MTKALTYKESGVDVRRAARMVPAMAAIARKTHRRGLLGGIGGFAGLFDLGRYRNPVLVSSTDGVGTKLKVAFAMNNHRTVGIDLVAMSVNDVVTQGAEPLFFLDYFATGKLRARVITAVLRGVAEGCRMAGCALMGGETAEMPGFYEEGEYDLAGFCVGVADRANLLDPSAVRAGDLVIGLPSNGLHSNGYSLARRVLLEHAGLRLGGRVPELGCSLGRELLKPTRIYAKVIKALVDRYPIHGIAHITGGGLAENVPRILPPGHRVVLRRSAWSVPPIFDLIARLGRVPQAEMDRTFNNGIGMVLLVAPPGLPGIEQALRRRKEPYRVIGEVRRGRRGVSFSN